MGLSEFNAGRFNEAKKAWEKSFQLTPVQSPLRREIQQRRGPFIRPVNLKILAYCSFSTSNIFWLAFIPLTSC